jgi:hypothetical protein
MDGWGGLQPSLLPHEHRDPAAAAGSTKWWQQRFQVVYLPNITYSDGSNGFVQLDVSVQGDRWVGFLGFLSF